MLGTSCASIKKKPISGKLITSVIISAFCCFAVTQYCQAENPEVYPGGPPGQSMPPSHNPFFDSNRITVDLHRDAENMYSEDQDAMERVEAKEKMISEIEELDFEDYSDDELANVLKTILTWVEIYGCIGFENKKGITIHVEKIINEAGMTTATVTLCKNSEKLVIYAEYEKKQDVDPKDLKLLIHSFEALGDGKDELETKIIEYEDGPSVRKDENKRKIAKHEKGTEAIWLPKTKRTLFKQNMLESSEKRREWTGIKFESKDIIKDDAKITFKTGKINSNSWSTDDNILKELFVEGADDHGVENTQKEYETEDIQAQINEKAMLCVKTALGLMEREFYESIETINKAIPGAICVTENEPDGLVKRALIVFPLLDAEIDEAENKGKEGEGEV